MLTESWLTTDKEQAQTIADYNLYNSNHCDRIGGGVAIFTHSSLVVKEVKRFTSKTVALAMPEGHKKKLSSIYGCIYHSKSKRISDTEQTIRYLSDTITQLARKYGNNIVMGDDFNHPDMHNVSDIFDLHNISSFPTRLDKIYTNIEDLRQIVCEKLPPHGCSDHDTAFMPSTAAATAEESSFYNKRK